MWERSAQTPPPPPFTVKTFSGGYDLARPVKPRYPNAARSPSRGSRPPPSAQRWPGPGLPPASRWSGCAAEALGGVELRRGRLPGGRGAMLSYPTACRWRSGRCTPVDSSSPGGDDGGRGGREGPRPPPPGHSPALRPAGWARGERAAREEPKRRRPDPEAPARSRRPRALMTSRPSCHVSGHVTWPAGVHCRLLRAWRKQRGGFGWLGAGNWGRRGVRARGPGCSPSQVTGWDDVPQGREARRTERIPELSKLRGWLQGVFYLTGIQEPSYIEKTHGGLQFLHFHCPQWPFRADHRCGENPLSPSTMDFSVLCITVGPVITTGWFSSASALRDG